MARRSHLTQSPLISDRWERACSPSRARLFIHRCEFQSWWPSCRCHGCGAYEKVGAISGSVFVDANGNGLRDVGETGLSPIQGENTPSVRVYLDTNGNEVLDAGEPTTITDSNGQYSFTQLMPGDHTVRSLVASQRQLYQTSPIQTSGRLFGVHPVADATSSTGFRWFLAEINPQNGATIRNVSTGIAASGSVGVAFDGELVQIFANATGTLYQFRPEGQLVVQSVVPSTVLFSGLAYMGGLTYYLEQTNSWPVLVAYDPKTFQAVRRMPLTHSLDGYGSGATFPTVGLGLESRLMDRACSSRLRTAQCCCETAARRSLFGACDRILYIELQHAR